MDDQEEERWRLGKLKFYDANKEFGFTRDLTVSDYTEDEDDVYIGDDVSAPHELTDDSYIVFRKVPSSKKPGTFKAEDVRPLLNHSDDIEPLVKEVASTSERKALNRYLQSERANWQIGKVKFFDSDKGFGFIEPLKQLDLLNGDDAYINESNISRSTQLSDGAYVVFRIAPSQKPEQFQAVQPELVKWFDLDNVCFVEDLAFWMLGEANLRLDVSTMAHLVPQSNAAKVLDLIERVARGDEQRPEKKRGTALRILGKVLEKAEEQDFLPSKSTESIWKKYGEEVRRLVTRNIIPSRVESLLWIQGLVKTLDPEVIDALIYRALWKKAPDRNIDLSFNRRSFLTSNITQSSEAIELTKIANRLSADELADCAVRHAQKVEDELEDRSKVTISRLDKHRKLLNTLRQECGSEVREDINTYAEAVRTYAGALRSLTRNYPDRNLSNEQAFSLWRDNLIDEITYSEFFAGFTQTNEREQRTHLLERLELEQKRQFAVRRSKELLKAREEDSTDSHHDTLVRWFEDVESFSETAGGEGETTKDTLRDLCETVVREEAQKKTQVVLYGEGYLSSIPEEWLLAHSSQISRSELEPVLDRIDSSTAERILKARLDDLYEIVESEETSIRQADYLPFNYKLERSECYLEARWLLAAAERSLTDSIRTDFQSALAERIDLPTHVQLYQEDQLNVDPESRILEYLEDLTVDAITTAQSWVEDDILEAGTLTSALHAYLCDIQVDDRESARCVQKAVRRLEEHAPGQLDLSDMSSEIGREITRLTWWIDDENGRLESVDFGLSLLRKGLCWLSDEDQVAALRKTFYMHVKGRVSLTPSKLTDCSSFKLEDKDQPKDTGRSRDSAPPLGLSAELIIQTISRVAETGEFPREGYLVEIMQHVTRDDPSRRVQVLDIFNRCEGRASELEMGSHVGKVEEVIQNGRRKFIISFEYFEELVESVKRLPGRRYDPDRKVWIVPAENEDQREATFQFARNHSFFIDLQDGKHWTNNEHLVEKPREENPPRAVTYCEGRKAKNKDFETYDFWWCRNEKCYASCHGRHEEEDWELYTVEDFLALLGLEVDEDTPHGVIEMGQYHRFLGWINRFNQLVDRLYCRECGHTLDSSKSSNYSHYRVTDFHCSNKSCSKYKEDVYLHHCLNPKCGSVIDSRNSEQCPNDWWICTNDNCGACCSTATLRRRRENRKEVGLPTSDYIRRFIEQKKGHLERSKHFCYECGEEMVEYSDEKFRCPEGHVDYDLVEADFDRSYRELDNQ